MDGPPPPPPHGANPHNTAGSGPHEGGYRRSTDLPEGNYDIFIIPPHSSGSGFLYLPSLQCQRNSFVAGVLATLVAVALYVNLLPVLKVWCATVVASGGMGVVMLVLAVAAIGWAVGKSQSESEPKRGSSRAGSPGGGANPPGSGPHGAGPGTAGSKPPPGGERYQGYGGQYANGGFPGAQGPGGQHRGGPYPGAHQYAGNPNGPPPPADSDAEPESERERRSKSKRKQKQADDSSSDDERAETRKKKEEEERKRREEVERKRREQEEAARKREEAEAQKRREEELRKQQEETEKAQAEAKRKEEIKRKMDEFRQKKKEEEEKKKEQMQREAREKEYREWKETRDKAKAEKEAAEKAAAEEAAREKLKQEAAAKYAAIKEAAKAKKEAASVYGSSSPEKRETAGKGSIPETKIPTPQRTPLSATAKTVHTEDDAYSFRPYDRPRSWVNKPGTAASVLSDSTYAPSQSTARTTPPPSHRGPYATKDPEKVIIHGVYSFNNTYMRAPIAKLVSGQGNVTDGLILRITTEGMFVDDDVRGIAQREWDVKAWTMKLVEVWCPLHGCIASSRPSPSKSKPFRFSTSHASTKLPTSEESDVYLAELLNLCKNQCRLGAGIPSSRATSIDGSDVDMQTANSRGYHVVRASLRDQEGKKYVFVLRDTEGWKVAQGLQRLRKGSQVRALGVCGLPANETTTILTHLGY